MKIGRLLKLMSLENNIRVVWFAYGSYFDSLTGTPDTIAKKTAYTFKQAHVTNIYLDTINNLITINCEVCK